MAASWPGETVGCTWGTVGSGEQAEETEKTEEPEETKVEPEAGAAIET